MILLISNKKDYTTDFVVNKLNKKKILYKRFNQEDIFKIDYNFTFNTLISNNDYSILNSKFTSIWFRRSALPELPDTLSEDEKKYILTEINELYNNMYEVIDANWVSAPKDIYRAENKMFQLKTAAQIGFEIPNTLITSSHQNIINFYNENDQNIIIKPLSQTRIGVDSVQFIYTNKVKKDKIEEIMNYDITPCIFQQNIEKEYELRVTVVGEDVFSAVVYSQADEMTKFDWRRKRLDFKEVKIPMEVEEKCVLLLKKMNLKFGAIDIIKTTKGNYIFLEINPNGQWVWIEIQTGLQISNSLIKLLDS